MTIMIEPEGLEIDGVVDVATFDDLRKKAMLCKSINVYLFSMPWEQDPPEMEEMADTLNNACNQLQNLTSYAWRWTYETNDKIPSPCPVL